MNDLSTARRIVDSTELKIKIIFNFSTNKLNLKFLNYLVSRITSKSCWFEKTLKISGIIINNKQLIQKIYLGTSTG